MDNGFSKCLSSKLVESSLANQGTSNPPQLAQTSGGSALVFFETELDHNDPQYRTQDVTTALKNNNNNVNRSVELNAADASFIDMMAAIVPSPLRNSKLSRLINNSIVTCNDDTTTVHQPNMRQS